MAFWNNAPKPRKLIDGSTPREHIDSHTPKEEVERRLPSPDQPGTGYTPRDIIDHYKRNPPRDTSIS